MNQPPPDPPRQVAVAFEVTSLARGRRRRIDPGWIVMGIVAALLVAAVAHPWPSSNPSVVVVPRPSRTPVVTANPTGAPIAPDVSTKPGQSPEDVLASEVYHLGQPAAPWGAGIGAAVGPPLQPTLEIPALGVATDDAWWAWIKLQPLSGKAASTAGSPTAIDALPAGRLCAGVPDLPTGGQVMLVTTPVGTPDPVQVQAWHETGWHDEPRDIEPVPGLSGLIGRHTGDVSYLELTGGGAWPDGRYEFRIPGSSPVSLTVCLGQP